MKTWQLIWHLIRYRPWLYILGGGLWSMFTITRLAWGLIQREFFNSLTGDVQIGLGLWGLIALLVSVESARLVMSHGAAAAEVTFHYTIGALLRKNLFSRILKHPGANALQASPAQAITHFRDDVNEIMEFTSAPALTIGHIVFSITAIVIMMRINLFITLVTLLPLMGVITIAHIAGQRIQKYREMNRTSTESVVGFLGEMLSMVQAIQAADAKAKVIDHFHQLNETRRKATVKDRLFNEILNSAYYHTVDLSIGVILILIGQAMRAGTFTVGDFSLFVYYLFFSTLLPLQLAKLLTGYKQSKVSVERLVTLLRGAPLETLVEPGPVYMRGPLPTIPFAPKTSTHRLVKLEASGLTYHYPDTKRGIQEISLSLPRGSFTVITGRVGSGKTTLLRTLLGLLPKDAGEIRWNGEIVADPKSFFVPPRCAYTSQVPRLFSETLRDNILMGLPAEEVDLPAAIHSAVMESDLTEMDQGLDTGIGYRGVRLSGGQIQRTAAARMVVTDSELLVFDDLSSALDVRTEQTLWKRIFDRQQSTCLVVSHRRAVLRRADHIIVLKNGMVADEGTLVNLLERCEEMQRLWAGDRRTVESDDRSL